MNGPRARRSIVLLLTVLAATASALGCGGSDVPVFSEGAAEIAVTQGERFRVEFEANPSVGDDWFLAGEPDTEVARLLDSGFETEAGDDVVGAPGTLYFLFEAVAPGETELVFNYCYRGCGDEGEELEHSEHFDVVVSG